MNRWLSLREWAAVVGVSRRRAQQWVQQGRIRTRRRGGAYQVRWDEPRPSDRRRKEDRT